MIEFSGNACIHLESFLSAFNISGLPEEYYHNSTDFCYSPHTSNAAYENFLSLLLFLHGSLKLLTLQVVYPVLEVVEILLLMELSWLLREHYRLGLTGMFLRSPVQREKQQKSCKKSVSRCSQHLLQHPSKTRKYWVSGWL